MKYESGIVEDYGNANPFDEIVRVDQVAWVVDSASKQKYDNVFFSLSPAGFFSLLFHFLFVCYCLFVLFYLVYFYLPLTNKI